MNPQPAITAVHEFADQGIAAMTAQTAAAGRPVTCSKNCSACCYEPVYADSREVDHALSGLNAEQLSFVKARTAQWVRQIEPSGLLKDYLPNAFAYRALKTPCPFLRENLCMVYARRPIACRLHMAVGAPKNCFDDELRKQQVFCQSPEMDGKIMGFAVSHLKGSNTDHVGVWLALRLFGQHLPSGTRGFISKKTAEKLAAFLK